MFGDSLTQPFNITFHCNTVAAAYTGELGTGHFLRYNRKSTLTDEFYFIK